MVPGGKETRAFSPNHSPALSPLYITHLNYFPFSFQRLNLSLHYFIVSLCRFQCLDFQSMAPHIGTPPNLREHAVYAPTWFQHVVMFSKSCAANKTVWSQVSRVRPEEVQFSAQASSYANIWFKWASEGRYFLKDKQTKLSSQINYATLAIWDQRN